MKKRKIGLLLIAVVTIVFLIVSFFWYEVKIYAPYPYDEGNYNYKLSFSEAKRYIELFNKETFYETEVYTYGQLTDSQCCRIEIRIGLKKQTIYLHHESGYIFTYKNNVSSENITDRQFCYFDWFGDYFKYHLEVDRKHNGHIQEEGKSQWWLYTESHDPYVQCLLIPWNGWLDYWGTVYTNGFTPLSQIVEILDLSYSNNGFISPFKDYKYSDEKLWDLYVEIKPDNNIFTYNGLEIMYVNGNCDLNSNFIVRPIDYVRKK